MRIRDKGVGVLEALNKRNGEFTVEDERLLSVLVAQAAVAIHNARLIQALQKAYEEISEITSMPMGTVKSRINRARAKVRDYLLQYPELLPAAFRP